MFVFMMANQQLSGAVKPHQKMNNDRLVAESEQADTDELQISDVWALIEPLAQAVWEADADGRVIKDSPSWRAYTGQTIGEWLGKDWVQAVHPDDRANALRQWQETIQNRTSISLECRLRSPDGGWRWTIVRAVPVQYADGSVRKWLGLIIDVDDRKKAELSLYESEIRQRLTLESAKDYAIFTTNLDRRVTSWNTGAEAVFGYAEDEIMGQSADRLFVPEDRQQDAPRHEAEKAIREGRAENERWHCRKDGSRLYGSGVVTPLRDDANTIVGLVKVMRDLTREKLAEEALRQSERFVQSMIASLPLIIYIFDLEQRRNLFLSPQVQQMFGYTAEEMQASGSGLIPTFFHPDDLPKVSDYFKMISTSPTDHSFGIECRMKHRERGWVWVQCRDLVYQRDADGRPTQLLGTAEDITERKRSEEALRKADRRKDEFLALLAHELRNPLATLHNTLLILQLTGGQDQSMTLPSAVSLMHREVAHLVRLVDDLLDVSRISRGKIALLTERVELVSVVQEAIEAIQGQLRATDRHLTVDLPTESIYLTGDPARLKQIVSNLLNNAAKFTRDGGHIWVGLEGVDGEAILRVRDDGIGIPAHELVRIFEMFAQVDSSLGRSQGGLGLGLTLVSELTGLHGGRVEAHSAGEGWGSEFVVSLPVNENEAKSMEETNQNQQPPAKRRVLVVDDNQDAATTLSMLLKLLGNDVYTRHDGRAGIEAADSLRPQVVILDISMPGLDGYQTCRLIREQPWGQAMTLIALSGYGQEDDKRRSREAGFDAHLVKPVDLSRLNELLG